jgi:hypothetical protein
LPGAEQPTFGLETIVLDLPALAASLGQRLRAAGLPVSPDVSVGFARALELVRPVSRRRLYWTARAVFVSDRAHLAPFEAVFDEVFHSDRPPAPVAPCEDPYTTSPPAEPDRPGRPERSVEDGGVASSAPPSADRSGQHGDEEAPELPMALSPSEEEVLRGKSFDVLTPHELAAVFELMRRFALGTPKRRTRRADHHRHGERIDLRGSVRASLRTGGDPVHLRRRRRRVVPRRLVLLCDISGSMAPYARAYLQFLTCAAGGTPTEAFVFATRLTRVTRALEARRPERAIQAVAASAPDWSSGTRIGTALKTFNDRHGRRGMARGAVVVILSDGWERGDPDVLAREMERLGRLVHRIVWVNPRAAAEGFAPRARGMTAALPFCDALLSGHSLDALGAVVEAIGGDDPAAPAAAFPDEPEEDSWASATPVAGSSVAMPSGYSPKRGHTTPGWNS